MCYNTYRVSERAKISITKAKAQVMAYLSFLAFDQLDLRNFRGDMRECSVDLFICEGVILGDIRNLYYILSMCSVELAERNSHRTA